MEPSQNTNIVIYNSMSKKQSDKLIRCLSAGFLPSVKQWFTIIRTLHVRIALECVRICKELNCSCLKPAIERQHQRLFQEVMQKIPEMPPNIINTLMAVKPFYLGICLNNGLDPNFPMSNKQTPLEYACRNSRLLHIHVLLSNASTVVSSNICCYMFRQIKLRRFACKAVQMCNDITPNMIIETLVANTSAALICVMEKLENKYRGNPIWTELCFTLRCPISLEYSSDLVRTPSGHFFDRECLMIWVRAHANNPMTREKIHTSDLLERKSFLREFVSKLQQKIQLMN